MAITTYGAPLSIDNFGNADPVLFPMAEENPAYDPGGPSPDRNRIGLPLAGLSNYFGAIPLAGVLGADESVPTSLIVRFDGLLTDALICALLLPADDFPLFYVPCGGVLQPLVTLPPPSTVTLPPPPPTGPGSAPRGVIRPGAPQQYATLLGPDMVVATDVRAAIGATNYLTFRSVVDGNRKHVAFPPFPRPRDFLIELGDAEGDSGYVRAGVYGPIPAQEALPDLGAVAGTIDDYESVPVMSVYLPLDAFSATNQDFLLDLVYNVSLLEWRRSTFGLWVLELEVS